MKPTKNTTRRKPTQLTLETLVRVKGGALTKTGLISEIGLPACDGAAKDAAF